MYAIIRTGGKQYKVQPGDVVQIEKVEHALGSEFNIIDILMVGGDKAHVGTPTVSNAKVTVVVTKQARTRKVYVFKKKRRHGYRKFGTHKQDFTEIFVKSITSPDGQTEATQSTPDIRDIETLRKERIQQKVDDSRARAEARDTDAVETKPAKKAAAPKKKAAAKKAAPKKAASKRSAKKATAKKTTKKK